MSDEDIESTQEKLRKFKIIMSSMTREELEDPKIIKSARVKRIARGSGMKTQDVRALLNHYNTSKKQMKGLLGNRRLRKQLEKQMKDGSFNNMGM